MLAQRQEKSQNKFYLSIRNNRLVQSSKEKVDLEWVEVKVVNPATKEEITKYYKYYDSAEGKPINLEWYSKEGTPFSGYRLELQDEESGEIYNIDFATSAYKAMNKFLTVAENIDWNQNLKLVVFPSAVKTKEGEMVKNADGSQKYETAVVFYQDGEVVKRRYTNENPCPVQPKKTKGGKWSFDDYNDYLMERVSEIIATNFNKESEPVTAEHDSSDLPF